MPRGTQLSPEEFASILASVRKIALKAKHNKNTIQNFLKNPDVYGKIKRTGPKPKIDERWKREIRRLAVNKNRRPKQIRSKISLNVELDCF